MTSQHQSSKPLIPSSETPNANTSPIYDLVCIGFGPAQIATAIANRESRKPLNAIFLEQKEAFSWYPGAHVPRARMKSSFIYDLATTRNPRSGFTYASYLLARNRLVDFLNSDRLNPLREEFGDYLRWCADQFEPQVRYRSEVIWVKAASKDAPIKSWIVGVRDSDGRIYTMQAKNVMAPSPSLKNTEKPLLLKDVDFDAGQRIISTEDYMSRREELRVFNDPRLDISVIGSSLKAIEILDDLLTCPRLGNVTIITDNDSLAPLKILHDDPAPPPPKLCSIWARPSRETGDVPGSSELIQHIYKSAYEKQVASKGQYRLRVLCGSGTNASPRSPIIISDNVPSQQLGSGIFHDIDSLVLGCRQRGDCLEEVQFKRGVTAKDCGMWMISSNSEGGRSLAKDIAIRAGEVVRAVSGVQGQRKAGGDNVAMINARM